MNVRFLFIMVTLVACSGARTPPVRIPDPFAHIHDLSAEPRLGERVGNDDPDDGYEVTESAQMYPAFRARYAGHVYTVAFDKNRNITYIATTEPGFSTPEGVHVGSTLQEVMSLGVQPPWREPGWAFHTELPSGWNAAFVQGASATEGTLRPDAPVAWLFKRVRGAD